MAIDRIVGVRFKPIKGINKVYAVASNNMSDDCDKCCFIFNSADCVRSVCDGNERSDKKHVYFKRER